MTHSIYSALIKLYPSSYQKEYGEQMLQTLNDFLDDKTSGHTKASIWFRVLAELPVNIITEHINNLEEKSMNNEKRSRKPYLLIAAISIIGLAGLAVLLSLQHQGFTPTKLQEITKDGAKETCLILQDDPSVKMDTQEATFLANASVSSIIDIPAGTSVDLHVKTYDGKTATATQVYGGSYGSYNLTAQKVGDTSDTFSGGWKVISFHQCQ